MHPKADVQSPQLTCPQADPSECHVVPRTTFSPQVFNTMVQSHVAARCCSRNRHVIAPD